LGFKEGVQFPVVRNGNVIVTNNGGQDITNVRISVDPTIPTSSSSSNEAIPGSGYTDRVGVIHARSSATIPLSAFHDSHGRAFNVKAHPDPYVYVWYQTPTGSGSIGGDPTALLKALHQAFHQAH
jgi:hypothetical protein